MMNPRKVRRYRKRLRELKMGSRHPMLPASSDTDDELGPILSHSDDDEAPLSFKRASASVKNRPSTASLVVSHNDDDAPLSFKRRASVKNRPSAANPATFDNDDDYESPTSFKRAITFVKNRSWAANPVIFDNDEDEIPLRSSKRAASTAVKKRPTLSKRIHLDSQLPKNHHNEQFSTEDSEGAEKTQKIEDHAKSGKGDGGGPKEKHKGTTSVPSIEHNMLAFIDCKREQVGMEQKASQQGQQYSISRCLEVLHGMDDVSDEIKVLASDVLKDAASREFFLCYESRLRGLWLKKEVAKLGTQLPPCY